MIRNRSLQPEIAYRNFSLGPRRQLHGMISRSDEKFFHLLLADRLVPYPNKKISVCYWYSHVHENDQTRSTIVVLPCSHTNHGSAFRLI